MSDDGQDSAASQDRGRETEAWKEKGVVLRASIYIFGTHLFAGFVWVLFYVGGHADK
ncbi:DUF6126 family protein [Streptomyces castrisilvae]|uniref:DUF6126 family protein n=1 Tax=Streptomyces castrisilvae TaxID=3033811 RepID=A0ABY9HL86_9ACTN|nr:DUF6126 family protein [Streptomyces sp. Mut1]WLQ35119.1 DUF6126 family protein [Streptomyces sp. Mut1]